MPFMLLIAPLMALYVKYKLVSFAVKLSLFMVIYFSFKATMSWAVETITSKLDVVNFGCTITYIINELEMFGMINFALSFWATIKVGKFFYNSIVKMI